MSKGHGVTLDSKVYNLVMDHETYVVSDIPAHPDSDSRMERRVIWDRFKGISKRREAPVIDQSVVSLNVYNRITKSSELIWTAHGGDTRMVDRIFGQRAAGSSTVPASAPSIIGDASVYSYFGCNNHLYVLPAYTSTVLNGGISAVATSIVVTSTSTFPASGNFLVVIDSETILVTTANATTFTVVGGVDGRGQLGSVAASHLTAATVGMSAITSGTQNLTLGKTFSSGKQVVDICAFNSRVFVAVANLKNDSPDYANPQPMFMWDQVSATANWSNPPTSLATPSWPTNTGASTLTVALTSSATVGDAITVTSTAAMPATGNFVVAIENEQILVVKASGTTLTIVARPINGTAVAAHGTVAITATNAIVAAGTSGTTRYDYQVIARSATADSQSSQAISCTYGNATLNSSNFLTLNWNAVGGAASYDVIRSYAGGNPASTGVIANVVGATTYNDQGAAASSFHYTVTPQFSIGDVGNAIAFTVIRGILWRAAGSKLWSWDGQQGTWSGESVIGDIGTNITALDTYRDSLVVFKQDGIYTMDRGGAVYSLFPGIRSLGFNPRPLGQWQGSYYFASDVGMVWEVTDLSVKPIGFDIAEAFPFPNGSYGLPNAVTRGIALPNYFIVGFNQWQSSANAGFWLAFDGNNWHPFRYDPNFQASALGITGGNQNPASPTLQFGGAKADASSFAINYMTSPTLDPYLVTSYDTITQYVYLPVESGIITDEWKILEGCRIYVEKSTAGTVRLAYAIDDAIDNLLFTDMGAPLGDRTAIQTFVPGGALPPYKKIMFRLAITPTASSATPIIRTVVMRYKQRELQRRAWDLVLFLEEGQMTPNRGVLHKTSANVLRDLNDIRRSKRLVKFIDIVGAVTQVYVEKVEESLKTFRTQGNNTSFVVKVRLVEPVQITSDG